MKFKVGDIVTPDVSTFEKNWTLHSAGIGGCMGKSYKVVAVDEDDNSFSLAGAGSFWDMRYWKLHKQSTLRFIKEQLQK